MRNKLGQFVKGSKPWTYGKKMSLTYRKKLSEAHIGQIAWNKGKKLSKLHLEKISGKNGNNWRGDNVDYSGLHIFGRKNFVKPKNCTLCGLPKKLDLANRTGVYNREIENWVFLCRSCHIRYDRTHDTSPQKTFIRIKRGDYRRVLKEISNKE